MDNGQPVSSGRGRASRSNRGWTPPCADIEFFKESPSRALGGCSPITQEVRAGRASDLHSRGSLSYKAGNWAWLTQRQGLDPLNVNNGSNNIYTVGELTGMTTEVPYPSKEINSPPGTYGARFQSLVRVVCYGS